MENKTIWNISKIESLTENQARDIALETLSIKGHTVYMTELGAYFGYSRLVFCNGHHIFYANDYQLHHSTTETREELRQLLIEGANSKLFTEEELAAPIHDYDEFYRKEYFLRNYYNMREDYISMFGMDGSKSTEGMIYDYLSFCYYPPEKRDFVHHHIELGKALYDRRDELKDNFEYQKGAFLKEMYNHEYGINWQADYDVLSVFCPGRLLYNETGENEIQDYFDQCHFTDTQRSAYLAARREYYANTDF